MYVQLLANTLVGTALYFTVAASFYLVFTSTKSFYLTHAAVISVGAYFTFLLTERLNLSLQLSVPLAILAALLLALFFELFIYRRMRAKKVLPLTYLLASLGLYIIVVNCISLYFGDDGKILKSGPVLVANKILGAYLTTVQIIMILTAVIVFVGLHILIHHTPFGTLIRAVSTNPTLCDIYGISSDRVISWCLIIGSALGAIGGILYGLNTNFIPRSGFDLLLYGIVAMIIGGVGGYRGLVFGSLLLSGAQQLTTFFIDKMWMDAVVYLILIVFLVWRPRGFSGLQLRKVEI
jgi:branched-chain amino acid transport system permease protein